MLSKMATLQVPTQDNVLENGATLDRICLISGCVEVRVVKNPGFLVFCAWVLEFCQKPRVFECFCCFFLYVGTIGFQSVFI